MTGRITRANVILLVAVGSTLAGCSGYVGLNAVPYDLRNARAEVENRGVISQNDLLPFTNSPPSIYTASLPLGYFQLRNVGNRSLRIKVRAMPGDWQDLEVPSGESVALRCGDCTTPYVQIAIPTEGRDIVVRTISLQNRYNIFWDESEKRWDLRTVGAG